MEKVRLACTFWPACTNTGFREGTADFWLWEGQPISAPRIMEEWIRRQGGGYPTGLEAIPQAELEKAVNEIQGWLTD